MPDETKPNDRQHEEAERNRVWNLISAEVHKNVDISIRLRDACMALYDALRDSASRTEGEKAKCWKCGGSGRYTGPSNSGNETGRRDCPICNSSDSKGHDKAAGNQVSQKETTAGAASASIAATSIPAAPFSDAEIEELAKVLHAERNPEFSDWDGLRGTDETGAKRSERECFIGLARACLRWFRSRPAPAAKGDAEEAGP